MENQTNTTTDDDCIKMEKKLRHREIARRSAAKKRAENPELTRERGREYMRVSGKAREYYWKHRDEIIIKKRELYAQKKQLNERTNETLGEST